MRRPLRLLAGLLAVVALYVCATFAQVWWTAQHDDARPVEAILVLGAAQYQGEPSPVFRARLDHAAALYAGGLAPVVVVTGGRQAGDEFSEANAAFAYLRQRGVPESALRQETGGTTSYESIAASARFLDDEGIEEVVLVSDGWHLERSEAIAESVGLTAWTSPTPTSPYSTASAIQQMLRESVGLSVGRLIGFRRLDRLTALAAVDVAVDALRS